MAMGIVLHGLKYLISPLVDMHTLVGVILQTVGSLSGAAVIYLGIAYYFDYPELTIVKSRVKKILNII